MKVERIEINKIVQTENSRANVDKNIPSLMSSIQQHGLQEPIGVNSKNDGTYEIVYGNRRLNACFKLGWKTIPCVLYSNMDDKSLLINNLIENIQRESVSPSEIGRICEQLEKKGLSVKEMESRLNIPAPTIKTVMDLYKHLPENIREKVFFKTRGQKNNGRITITSAKRMVEIRQEFGLSKENIRKLFEYSSAHELSNEDLKVVALLMKEGLSFTMAMKRREDYRVMRVDTVIIKDELEELAKKAQVTPTVYVEQIVYGINPPLSKPNFIEFKVSKHSKFKVKG